MAIAQMAKVIIVSFRAEASQLLEALQREGICQILNAEEAMVSKDSPDLAAAARRPRDIEEMLHRLQSSIAFLEKYAEEKKGLATVLSPRTVVDDLTTRWFQMSIFSKSSTAVSSWNHPSKSSEINAMVFVTHWSSSILGSHCKPRWRRLASFSKLFA